MRATRNKRPPIYGGGHSCGIRIHLGDKAGAASGCLLGGVLASLVLSASAQADEAEATAPEIVVTGERPDEANPNANPAAPYKVESSQNDKLTEKLRDTPRRDRRSPRK